MSSFLKLSPHISTTIWGGERLKRIKLIESEKPIGETWEISVHESGESLCAGRKLSEYVDKDRIPYLVKFIDTLDYLSVQVHPDDGYAKKYENSLGKTECWIILDSSEGDGIYLGLKDGVTKKEIENALLNKESMDKFLKFYPVSRGDFFFVPSGTAHAIGKNVFLIEIQQSSGITYRVWDWNRVDQNGNTRELHVKKAMDVIKFGDNYNRDNNFKYQKNILSKKHLEVISHPQFIVESISLKKGEVFKLFRKSERFPGVICLKGDIKLSLKDSIQNLHEYESLLILNELDNHVTIEALESCEVILVL